MWYDPLTARLAGLRKGHGSRHNRNVQQQHRRPRASLLRGERLEDRRLLSMSPWFGVLVHGFEHPSSRSQGSSGSSQAALTVSLHDRPSTSFYGQSVQLTAKVAGATNGTVEFFDGTTQLGTAVSVSSNGVANLATDTLAVGTHSITAEYFSTGATTATSTSTAVPETVNAAPTNTIVVASGNPAVAAGAQASSNVTFTAIVGSWGSGRGGNANSVAPAGTVTFTVADTAGDTPITATVTVDSTGRATFSPSALAAGTYDVTATFTPSDGNSTASSSEVLVEQVVAPSAVGIGSVTVGTSASPVTLRGGQQVSVDVTQAIDSTQSVLSEAGNGITYVDSARGINLTVTSSEITSVVFSSNGYQAEITGTGTNVSGTTDTQVAFTLLIDAGSGDWFSRPGISITISGTGINYQQSSRVSSGSIAVDGTASTTSILPLSSSTHDRALQSVTDEWGGMGSGGFHQGHWGRG